MVEVTVRPDEGTADFKVEDGCPACGGLLDVRVRPGVSWGYCPRCHWLARKQVTLSGNALQVAHLPGGIA